MAPKNWNGMRMRNLYQVIAPDSHNPRPTAGLPISSRTAEYSLEQPPADSVETPCIDCESESETEGRVLQL
jgi:hypothetical protein